MKRTIKLTESKLRGIIREAVKKVITEEQAFDHDKEETLYFGHKVVDALSKDVLDKLLIGYYTIEMELSKFDWDGQEQWGGSKLLNVKEIYEKQENPKDEEIFKIVRENINNTNQIFRKGFNNLENIFPYPDSTTVEIRVRCTKRDEYFDKRYYDIWFNDERIAAGAL